MRERSAGPPESQDKPRKPGWKQAAREIEFWKEQEKSDEVWKMTEAAA
ncbi:hypothetical protein [Methylococcus sp. Mc7]|nr:hypothetical protein [Methylococcus sp. Mc7]QXP83952.1 hypothetical protein KW115_17790 [Methylococcus sp. Mc7]